MIAEAVARFASLGDGAFVGARQLSHLTVRHHDVVAERSGLLGELRDELAGGHAAARTSLDAWLWGVAR
jgi:hypothetical protein